MDYHQKKKFIVNFLFFGLTALLVYVVLEYGMGMLSPFIIAFLIAWLMVKPAKWLCNKTKLPQKPVALLMVLLFYGIAVTAIAWPSISLVGWLIDMAARLPEIYNSDIVPWAYGIVNDVEQIIMKIDPDVVEILHQGVQQMADTAVDMISGWSSSAVAMLTSMVAATPGVFIKTLLMVICTFFIAADYDTLVSFTNRQLSERGRGIMREVKNFIVGTLFVCIRSYVIIMSMTFAELSIALSILGVKYSVAIAGLIAVFDVLPVLGTGGIVLPWAAISLLTGDLKMAIGLAVTYLIITVIRNIVEPRIVGAQLGIHPVVTLISMFVGVNVFGFLGLFGLPIFIALLKHLNDKKIIHIFK